MMINRDLPITTPLQRAMIMTSIIGSILSSYDPKVASERKKSINILKQRTKKFMFRRSKSNKNEFSEAIKISDRVWRTSVDYFAENNISIEAVSIILALYNLYEDELSKYANIHNKQIEAYARNSNFSRADVEQNSYRVADFIIDELAPYTGVQKRVLNLKGKVEDESKINPSR